MLNFDPYNEGLLEPRREGRVPDGVLWSGRRFLRISMDEDVNKGGRGSTTRGFKPSQLRNAPSHEEVRLFWFYNQ